MKDYSKFIPSSFGFITKYEIVVDEIHVYTPETVKGEPHKFPLTADWLKYIETRLETQYQLVLENRIVLEDNYAIQVANQVYIPVMVISTVQGILAAGFIAFNSWILALVTLLSIVLTVGGGIKLSEYKTEKFKKELDSYEAYLDNRKNMEDLSRTDPNVTEYLSKKATKSLERNEDLIQKECLDTIFSIDFMDKAALKDLKKLLTRYMISRDLLQEQKFIVPESKQMQIEEPKKLSRKDNRRKEK